MSIHNNIILNHVNITWKPCSKCGVLCYESDLCKPCKMKIQLLDTHPLKRFELNTIIDIINDIINELVLHVCRTLTIKNS